MVRPLHTNLHGTPPGRPEGGRARHGTFALLLVAATACATVAACGTPAPRPLQPEFDLRHPSATRRVEAVSVTVSTRDTSQVPALILLLEDDDDAVRLTAGSALRDLTGHDTGYRAFAPPEERARHAAEWRAWWAARGGAASPGVAPTGAGAPTGGYSGGPRHVGPP